MNTFEKLLETFEASIQESKNYRIGYLPDQENMYRTHLTAQRRLFS